MFELWDYLSRLVSFLGRSRYSLALTGITIVVASLATTIGLLSLAGVDTTLIVWEASPIMKYWYHQPTLRMTWISTAPIQEG